MLPHNTGVVIQTTSLMLVKIQNEVKVFVWQVLNGKMDTLDHVQRHSSTISFSGAFFVGAMRRTSVIYYEIISLLNSFGAIGESCLVCGARGRDGCLCLLLDEVLLNLPLKGMGTILRRQASLLFCGVFSCKRTIELSGRLRNWQGGLGGG